MADVRAAPLRDRIDRIGSRYLFLIVAGPLFVVFLLTSARSTPYHIDALSNVLTAWSIGTSGSVSLPEHSELTDPENFGNLAWLVESNGRTVSKYPPGSALIAAPFYAAWPAEAIVITAVGSNRPDSRPIDFLLPPLWPAAIASSLSVALAMGFLAISFRSLAPAHVAVVAAYVAGFGTTAWSVASGALWQHGPGMMWLALAGAIVARNQLASGLAYGAAILTRPLNAAVVFGAGTYMAVRDRSFRSALRLGMGAAVGLVLIIIYNWTIFGEPSISGGYSAVFSERVANSDVVGFLRNLVFAFVSPTWGLLVYSPFLIVLIPGLAAAWRAAPTGVRGAAIGATLYMLIQYKANRFSGGSGFAAYRYPLEPLTAAAPLLLLAYTQWVAQRPFAVRAFAVAAALSIAGQLAFVIVM